MMAGKLVPAQTVTDNPVSKLVNNQCERNRPETLKAYVNSNLGGTLIRRYGRSRSSHLAHGEIGRAHV